MVDFLEGGIRLFGKMLSKVVERLFFLLLSLNHLCSIFFSFFLSFFPMERLTLMRKKREARPYTNKVYTYTITLITQGMAIWHL